MATKTKAKKSATKAKAKAKKAPAKGRRRSPKTRAAATGVGNLIRELLHAGMDTESIVAQAREQFPKSAVGPKEVYWYAWSMRKEKGGLKPAKKRR